jgi:hypothetical protein
MHASESTVQFLHFLAMWTLIVVFFAISSFWRYSLAWIHIYIQPQSPFPTKIGPLQIPWCFLSLIILVVAGPINAQLAKLVTKIVAIGNSAPHLSANTPCRPDCILRSFDPGYVSARMAGKAV